MKIKLLSHICQTFTFYVGFAPGDCGAEQAGRGAAIQGRNNYCRDAGTILLPAAGWGRDQENCARKLLSPSLLRNMLHVTASYGQLTNDPRYFVTRSLFLNASALFPGRIV